LRDATISSTCCSGVKPDDDDGDKDKGFDPRALDGEDDDEEDGDDCDVREGEGDEGREEGGEGKCEGTSADGKDE